MSSFLGLPLSKRLYKYMKLAGIASLFGMAALVVLLADLTIPIPGTDVVMDPREVFVTIGSALTGPLGGVISGLLAGAGVPGGFAPASMLAHSLGGLWMGFAYKLLIYKHFKIPVLVFGWAGLVLVYYYLMLMPGFILGLKIFHGQPIVFTEMYARLASGALPEVIFTLLATSLVLLVMPKITRRPLW